MPSTEFDIELFGLDCADDVGAVGALFGDYFAELGAGAEFDIGKYMASVMRRMGERGRWLLLAKDSEGGLAGFSYFKIDQDERVGWGYMMEFYVRPEYRRRGLGRRMLVESWQLLAEAGAREMWLTTDPKAEDFWRACGFAVSGEVDENGLRVMVAGIE